MLASLLSLASLLALVYVAFVGMLYLFQRGLMYLPGPGGPPPAAAGVPEMREVQVETSDGLRLLAWYGPPREAEMATILYLHGNAGNLAARNFKIRPLLDAGYGVLLLSWRGYGDNPGRPTEEGLYRDGRAAMAFLEAEGVRRDRIVLYGESLGSGVAVQIATEGRVAGLILESPFSSIADIAAELYPFVPVRALLKDRFDSLAKIGEVEASILILHGARDPVVPLRFGQRLFDAAGSPKRIKVFPNGGHENLYALGGGGIVLEYLTELSAGQRDSGDIIENPE